MKKIVIIAVLLCFFSNLADADIFVLTDKDTSNVISVSNRNDTIPNDNQVLSTLKGKVENYEFQYHPAYYTLKNGRLIVNNSKINKEEEARLAKQAQEELEAKIQAKIRQQALDALKAEGVVDENATLHDAKEVS